MTGSHRRHTRNNADGDSSPLFVFKAALKSFNQGEGRLEDVFSAARKLIKADAPLITYTLKAETCKDIIEAAKQKMQWDEVIEFADKLIKISNHHTVNTNWGQAHLRLGYKTQKDWSNLETVSRRHLRGIETRMTKPDANQAKCQEDQRYALQDLLFGLEKQGLQDGEEYQSLVKEHEISFVPTHHAGSVEKAEPFGAVSALTR